MSWFGRVSAMAVCGLVALGGALAPAGAQSGPDRQSQLQNEIARLSQEQQAALANVRAIQDRKAGIDVEVAALDGRLSAAEAKLAPLAAEAARIDGVVADLQARMGVMQGELDAAKVELNASVAGMYRTARAGASSPLGFSGSPDRFVVKEKYLKRVSRERTDLVQRVTALRDDLDRQKQALHDQQVKADQARDATQGVRDQVASLRSQLEPARVQAAQQAAAEQSALSNIGTQMGDVIAELAAIQGAFDSISAALRAHPTSGHVAPCDVQPVPFEINNGFGVSGHPGVDMASPSGTPIRTCRAGLVVIASRQGGYGNAVVIDHGGNMGTLYGHQSQIAVSAGQHVNAGDVIGYVGSTGYSTGPHLHFEVRLGGNVVDPTSYLPA